MDVPVPGGDPHERSLGVTRTDDRLMTDALRDLLRYAWRGAVPPLPIIVAANELLVDAGLPTVIPDCSHTDHNHFGYIAGAKGRYGLVCGSTDNWEPCRR